MRSVCQIFSYSLSSLYPATFSGCLLLCYWFRFKVYVGWFVDWGHQYLSGLCQVTEAVFIHSTRFVNIWVIVYRRRFSKFNYVNKVRSFGFWVGSFRFGTLKQFVWYYWFLQHRIWVYPHRFVSFILTLSCFIVQVS